MAAIPSSSSHVATQDYYWCFLWSTSSNSFCACSEYPSEGFLHDLVLPKANSVIGGYISFWRSLLSCSWIKFWSPQSTWNLPSHPAA
ncbi:pancreatic progenitor cell differentiation and proliferation factor-like [Molossus molossus]|uniref:pancreatic progenitor cell differentiation and proliferation factor-like n=1 Tax=Molossus molossus TaxID=27622 RepID=UPI0017474DFD|nr:pancreatic progenitor cell differentiation and proliferation factor-like [Molossus molossus]